MKYIDADRLKAEIEKGTPNNLQLLVYRDIILSLIDSLQQEQQEVDLEGEITRFLSNVTNIPGVKVIDPSEYMDSFSKKLYELRMRVLLLKFIKGKIIVK